MGASAERLARVAASSTVHYFRKNFRATPYLLDILVRYSLKVLRSKWLFLPRPSETAPEKGELYCGPGGLTAAVDMALKWIDRGLTPDVAFLVRRNKDADQLEQIIKSRAREIRYVKVSGVEIFELPAMRDFISFCTLLNEGGSHPLRRPQPRQAASRALPRPQQRTVTVRRMHPAVLRERIRQRLQASDRRGLVVLADADVHGLAGAV